MYATLANVINKEQIEQAYFLALREIPTEEYDFGGFEFDENNIYLAWSIKCKNSIILRLNNDDRIYRLLYEDVVWEKIKGYLDGRRTQEHNSRT